MARWVCMRPRHSIATALRFGWQKNVLSSMAFKKLHCTQWRSCMGPPLPAIASIHCHGIKSLVRPGDTGEANVEG
eukprot:3653733-Pleurochrysis_carterae.AAC.1